MESSVTGHYIESSVAGEVVQAYVPAPLPPKLSDKELAGLNEHLQDAQTALARLDLAGAMIPSLDWFIYAFVRKEALVSSEIEGTQATLVDVLSYEHTQQHGSSSFEDIEEVTNYIQAISYGLDQIRTRRGLPISVRLLNESHRILMHGVRGADKQPGEIRRSQNWVGGSGPGNAVFVPPPHGEVPGLLSDLEKYIHEATDLPPLLRTALAHVQFESIHPYLDGNGRVGRMLIALLLDHWKLLSSPLLYLSVYLKEHRDEYYRWLSAIRIEGRWAGWLEFFLVGIQEVSHDAAARAQALHRQVSADRKKLHTLDRVTVTAIQLFELLPEHPVISTPVVTRLLDTTKPTAGKAIGLLNAAGILSELGKRKRDRVFGYQRYLELLE